MGYQPGPTTPELWRQPVLDGANDDVPFGPSRSCGDGIVIPVPLWGDGPTIVIQSSGADQWVPPPAAGSIADDDWGAIPAQPIVWVPAPQPVTDTDIWVPPPAPMVDDDPGVVLSRPPWIEEEQTVVFVFEDGPVPLLQVVEDVCGPLVVWPAEVPPRPITDTDTFVATTWLVASEGYQPPVMWAEPLARLVEWPADVLPPTAQFFSPPAALVTVLALDPTFQGVGLGSTKHRRVPRKRHYGS
jgi:hypothetical protein